MQCLFGKGGVNADLSTIYEHLTSPYFSAIMKTKSNRCRLWR